MKPATSLDALDYVVASGQALGAAQNLATKVASEGEKIATLAPQRVDQLAEAGLIQEHEKEAAVTQLSSHEGALAVVANLVNILGETKQAYDQKAAAAGNGHGVPAGGQPVADGGNGHVKSADAGIDLTDGGYVGRRRGAGEKSAADHALITGLGLAGRIGNRSGQ